ncbi:alanine/ornithine racemase family PLP-dependent enzyme [Clostridia bacterium OttesenSCG-928-O13]|nr:alanine/ornithine racemase family PLP-dependent enzyme [Clostridia bacterium OttesenSCG-928-O13]
MVPKMLIDLGKLRYNAQTMVTNCAQRGIGVAAVTKVFCADEKVVGAFAQTGVEWLADSRVQNIQSYPAGHGKKTMLLRAPLPQQAAQVVAVCDASLNSEQVTLAALAEAAAAQNKRHGVVLMVDLGDLREGLYYTKPEAVLETAGFVLGQKSLALLGLGVNLTCYGAIIPTREKMETLCGLAAQIESRFSVKLPVVSGGNSSSVQLLLDGQMPKGITNLRLGESLARAEETAYQQSIPGLEPDAVVLEAGLVEVQEKPSYPDGDIGLNAFGEKTHYEDRGPMLRGIVALGRQDTDHEGLACQDRDVEILGASSDHLIVNLSASKNSYKVGDTLRFSMNYSAILKGFTSKYVDREYIP